MQQSVLFRNQKQSPLEEVYGIKQYKFTDLCKSGNHKKICGSTQNLFPECCDVT